MCLYPQNKPRICTVWESECHFYYSHCTELLSPCSCTRMQVPSCTALFPAACVQPLGRLPLSEWMNCPVQKREKKIQNEAVASGMTSIYQKRDLEKDVCCRSKCSRYSFCNLVLNESSLPCTRSLGRASGAAAGQALARTVQPAGHTVDTRHTS